MDSEVKSLTSEVNIKFEPEFDSEIDSFECKSRYSTQVSIQGFWFSNIEEIQLIRIKWSEAQDY